MVDSIEFHDSTISSVAHDGEAARVTLDAYVHRWERVHDSWKGTGWGQRVEIVVIGAPNLTLRDLPAELSGGCVRSGQVTHENMVPLPFTSSGPASVRFDLVSGEVLDVAGRQLLIAAMGDRRFIEHLPGEFGPGAG